MVILCAWVAIVTILMGVLAWTVAGLCESRDWLHRRITDLENRAAKK